MNKTKAYSVLGLKPGADEEAIKKAWRKLRTELHPDHGGDEKKFKEAKEAYETLTNPQPETAASGFEEYVRRYADPFGPSFTAHSQTAVMVATIDVSLKEAFNGCYKQITMPGTPQPVSIYLPPGFRPDDLIKTVSSGNVIYKIFGKIVEPGTTIDWGERDKFNEGNITKEISVSPIKMMLGGWEDVKLFDDSVMQVRIPQGLSVGKLLKIKDAGYWKKIGNGQEKRGDCFLRVNADIKKLNDYPKQELTELYDALDKIINTPDGV